MKKLVTVKSVTLNAGSPKVTVPLVAETSEALKKALAEIRDLSCDFVEFRVDFLKQAGDADYVMAELANVRNALPYKPLLFTFRRAEEGGSFPCSDEYYFELLNRAIDSGMADLIDIELFAGEEKVKETVAHAKEKGVLAILCNHDFEKTPPKEEIVGRLRQMEEWGGDICKIAVMPQTPADVLTLLDATQTVYQTARQPIVTMSMGEMGIISRLAGEHFGSAMTFGAARKVSAPGQIGANDLRYILNVLAKH
ncbi:type I 3-dehydroquinate dehydratase [Neisseria sp.]|uniref:type I 3-dehydroquinate dehydratase n=1 Tax=Neisseria sp. TaxID=192066 RepID=UPI00359FBB80